MSFLLFLNSMLTNAYAGAEVSGFNNITGQNANMWSAIAAIDNNMETAWMTSANSQEELEWIQIDAPTQPTKLTQISIVNGYAKDADTFKNYSKIKKLKIEAFAYNESRELFSTKNTVEIELQKTAEPQLITLPKPLELSSASGGKYRLWIVEAYKPEGENYPDNIAMTELKLFLEDEDIIPKIEEEENMVEGEDIFSAMDDKKSTHLKLTTETKLGFDGGDNSMTRVAIVPSSDNRYAKIKKLEVSVGGRTTVQEFPEKIGKDPIWIWLPSVTGYPGGSSWDTTYIQVLETYPGSKFPEAAISELKFRGIVPPALDVEP